MKIGLGVVVLAAAIYVYYTEDKPVVIFGQRDDYAHAIPFQKVPEGLASLSAESCGQCHREGTPVQVNRNIHQGNIIENYSESIHGEGLFKRGLTVVAVCSSCHTSVKLPRPNQSWP